MLASSCWCVHCFNNDFVVVAVVAVVVVVVVSCCSGVAVWSTFSWLLIMLFFSSWCPLNTRPSSSPLFTSPRNNPTSLSKSWKGGVGRSKE